MRFQTELVPATLIRRCKRFLADCRLEDGREVTAHCANPGSMMGMAEPGMRIWLEPNDDPKKKLRFGWRLIEHSDGHFTGIDTSVPNKALREALETRAIAPLAAYRHVRPEQKYGKNSRIDFLLQSDGLPDAYVEIKSVTLSRRPGLAEFPDSITARGAKHLEELAEVVQSGHRGVMLYLVQRTDCTQFALASDIDPKYAEAYARASSIGVETLCYGTHIDPTGVTVSDPIAVAM